MSFTKKINIFLEEAFSQGVVDCDAKQKLQIFAKNYQSKSIASLLNLITFFGGIAIILGLILIISHNWRQISDFTKITFYIITLVGLNISACLLNKKYPQISRIIYFIGAFYILAGIGLIAQIYHLSSNNGEAYLLWFIMILPLAILLRDAWIGILAMLGFYIWANINGNFNFYNSSHDWQGQVIFATATFSSMILIAKSFSTLDNSFNHLKIIGYIFLGIITFVMGLTHQIFAEDTRNSISLHPITIGIIIFNAICLTSNFIKIFRNPENFKKDFLGIIQMPNSLIVALILAPLFIVTDYELITSITYWIIWFWGSGLIIYKGETEKNKALINTGIWCVMLGLIARFIDLAGTMLFTGSAFILFGVILISITFIAEKYRKRLISKVFKNAL